MSNTKKQPTEAVQLEKIQQKKLEREKKVIKHISEYLLKMNCVIVPDVDIKINNKPIGLVIKAI